MFARMQDIRRNKLDEDGLGINNVEISLKKADVALRDVRGNWRNFGDVLEELAGKWSTLSDTERAYISKSIAGVRQINTFTVLMENMGRALELQEVQFNSTGLAIERYNIYLESLEAKITTLKTTLEGIWQEAITSGLIESFVDAGVAVLKFIEDIGGIQTVLLGAGGIALLLKLASSIQLVTKTIIAFQIALSVIKQGIPVFEALSVGVAEAGKAAAGSSTMFSGLSASVATTIATVAGALVVLGALAYVIERNTYSTKELVEEIEKTNETIAKTSDSIKTARDLQEEYVELQKTLPTLTEGTDEYTTAQERLYAVQKQLKDILPEVTASLDAQGHVIIKDVDQIKAGIGLLEEYNASQKKMKSDFASRLLFNESSEDIQNSDAYKPLDKVLDTIGKSYIFNAYANLASNPLLSEESKTGYEEQADSVGKTTSKINDLANAYKELENAKPGKDFAEKFEEVQLILSQTTDGLRAIGSEAAKKYLEGVDPEFAETKEYENIKNFIENVLPEEEAEKAGQIAAESYQEGLLRGFKGMGYNDVQAENAVDYGAAGSQELTERLLTAEVPVMTKNLSDLSNAFDAIGSKELISPEQMEMFNKYGISLEFLTDGTQRLSLENGTLVNTEEALIDAMMANLRETYNMTDEQAEIARAYLEREYAANKVKDAEAALKDELSELSAMNSAIVAAQKEYADATQLSADTAYDLTTASDTLAGAAYASGDAMLYDADAAEAALKAKVQLILTDAGLEAASKAVAGGLYDQAIAMIATGAAAQQLAGNLQPVLDALGTLANFSTPGFNWGGVGGGSGGGSGRKKEDPRIKENEKLIDQLEDQIDLREDEKDALKKMQDEYNKWIDKQKESLKLAKEESDYFKEQQERTTNLANLKKEIALLELDNTEEARAKRLKLEEEAAKLEKEIAENTEDRQYDLQMQALDNLKQAYDEMIEKQIEAIDLAIEGIRDQIETLRDLIAELREENSGSGGSGGGSGGRSTGGTRAVGNTPYILQGPYNPNGTHNGVAEVDIAKPFGSDEYALQSGTIKAVGSGRERGDYVVIAGDDGIDILYGHLAEGTAKAYESKIGNKIKQGDVVAQTGNTGTVGDTPHSLMVFGEYTGSKFNNGMKISPEADEFMYNFINNFTEEYLIPFGYAIKAATVGVDEAVNKTKVIIKDSSGYIDNANSSLANKFIEAGVTTNEGMVKIIEGINRGAIDFNGTVIEIGNTLDRLGIPIDMTADAFYDFIDYIKSLQGQGVSAEAITDKPGKKGKNTRQRANSNDPLKPGERREEVYHEGGVVGETDKNTFSGGLKSNEIFARLLKGEVVANEAQIRRFLNDTMPTITKGAVEYNRINSTQPISINMPINVEGNLEKDVLPDLEFKVKGMLNEIMKQITQAGYIRPVNRTIS